MREEGCGTHARVDIRASGAHEDRVAGVSGPHGGVREGVGISCGKRLLCGKGQGTPHDPSVYGTAALASFNKRFASIGR